MNVEDAQKIADEVVGKLNPYCSRIQVVGSIRRQRADIRDIDILLIPSPGSSFGLSQAMEELFGKFSVNGDKIKRAQFKDQQIDLFFADETTWDTLMLIRTGSVESNIRLTSLAKSKKWKLWASGKGLTDETGKVIATTEQGIFEALGIQYLTPEMRQ